MGKLQERAVSATEPPIGARFIALTQGKFAIVDESDYQRLARFNWFALKDKHTFYAVRNVIIDGKSGLQLMHRAVLGDRAGAQVDHFDGDGLNNRRHNLRACTVTQNRMNLRHTKAGKSSRWKGVYREPKYGRRQACWRSVIRCSGRTFRLGRFENEDDAARAYDSAAKALFGEFAALNFNEEPAPFTSTNGKLGRPRKGEFIGVEKRGERCGWRATIYSPYRHIGTFLTAVDAARAYDAVALERHGVRARLNFPKT